MEFISKAQAEMEFMAMTDGMFLKERGKKKAVEHHTEELANVQAIARHLAKIRGIISIDDVREVVEHWNLGNAAGAVFDGGEWECVGMVKAKRKEAHARMIRQWRLKQRS